jgi:hypothetical protein
MKTIILSAVLICLLISTQGVYAQKPYWTATDKNIPPDMKAYHLIIDGVNPVWGQNGTDNKRTMQLSHDGLKLGLEYGDKPIDYHNIIVTPSAYNATYDAGFFVVPKSLNESKISIGLKTKYIGAWVGEMLHGPTSHINIDMLYSDVSTYRFCIEHYHVKPGTQKFLECYEGAS